jgi:hypothetical protein
MGYPRPGFTVTFTTDKRLLRVGDGGSPGGEGGGTGLRDSFPPTSERRSVASGVVLVGAGCEFCLTIFIIDGRIWPTLEELDENGQQAI